MKRRFKGLPLLVVMLLPVAVQAQFDYKLNNSPIATALIETTGLHAQGIMSTRGDRGAGVVLPASQATPQQVPVPAPDSIAGEDTFLMKISAGTYPFLADSGYWLFFPAAAGHSFQVFGIYYDAGVYDITTSSGTYSYLAAGGAGLLNLINGTDSYDSRLSFGSANTGVYGITNTASWPILEEQTGQFEMFSGQAPSSLAGKRFLCTIDDGHSPCATTGTFDFITATSGNRFSVFVLSGDGNDGAGTYSYSRVNAMTGRVRVNDPIHGSSTAYVVFSTPMTGALVVAPASSGGFQVSHFVLAAPTITIAGSGTISPNLLGSTLTPGMAYTVTANPAAGQIFAGWTGSIATNAPNLSFVMRSGMNLIANFVPNPFTPAAGNYAGLYYDAHGGGVTVSNAGYFTAKVTSSGGLSAGLQQLGHTYSFSGQFSPSGAWHTESIKGYPGLIVSLQLNLNGGDEITGTISNGVWSAQIEANRSTYSKANPTPWAGQYTLVIPGSPDFGNLPGGNAAASVSVRASGAVSVTGTLGDGSTVTESTFVSKDGQWPLYASLYSNKGLILGWMTFTNDVARTNNLEGLVAWLKPGGTGTKLYPHGFDWPYHDQSFNAFGSTFANQTPLLDWTAGVLILENGNLARSITNELALGNNNKVTGTNGLKLTITTSGPNTGSFTGSVLNPATKKPIPFNGTLLLNRNSGFGVFSGTNQTGSVYFGPE